MTGSAPRRLAPAARHSRGACCRRGVLPARPRPLPRRRAGPTDPARGARWARRVDLRPCSWTVVRPTPVAWPGHRSRPPPLRSSSAAERAQSVVVVGPTQSGKTTSLAVPAILDWEGPVVAASVKSDLLRHTQARRNERGRIWCIDPSGRHGRAASTGRPSPRARAWAAARRVACGSGGVGQGRRHHGRRGVLVRHGGQVAGPAAVRRGPRRARHGRRPALGRHPGGRRGVPDTRTGGRRRSGGCRPGLVVPRRAHAQLGLHDRGDRSWPRSPDWRRRRGATRSNPATFSAVCHTLYLCAPAHDQRRLRGLLHRADAAGPRSGLRAAPRARASRWIRPCSWCSTKRRTSPPCPSSTAWPPPAPPTGSNW